jgi:endonuclease/exonuclease/phosphatase family metal-dependent hydrolase
MRRPAALLVAASLLFGPGAVIGARAVGPDARPICGHVPRARNQGLPSTFGRPELRVASFNMLHGLTDTGERTLEARLPLAAKQLVASGAGVIGLQEVTDSANHGLVIERLAKLMGSQTGGEWWWCFFRTEPHAPVILDTRDGGGDQVSDLFADHYNSHEKRWYEGAAVLSRWPITASAAHRLPGEDVAGRLHDECLPQGDPTCVLDLFLEPRAALWARIATPYWGPISFTVTHTSGNAAQHRDLATWAATKSAGAKASYLTCDCNALETSAAQGALRDAGWIDTFRALHRRDRGYTSDQDVTAAKSTVGARIDYVFTRTGALRTRTASVFMNRPARSTLTKSHLLWPSDHYGVIASFR